MLQNNDSDVLQTDVQNMKEKVVQQDQDLSSHTEAIADLKEQLSALKKEVEELRGQVAINMEEKGEDGGSAEDDPDDIPLYSLDQSMWDATIMLFTNGVAMSDKITIAIGTCLNLGLQITLLVVISMNMLDAPFTNETVEEMIKWRVDTGHADDTFDAKTGLSRVHKLCSLSLWTFEGNEYQEMYDYLYKGIPGWMLSALAIVLWVLTITVEYRKLVEQFLSLWCLPAIEKGEPNITRTSGGFKFQGIRPRMRWLATVLLTLPRLGILAVLGYVGCRYLAQTVSLADIVLNAVALAFVLDVDELICHTLCSQKVRVMLESMEPLPCSKSQKANHIIGALTAKDIIRYGIFVAVVTWACMDPLICFNQSVNAAAAALCGGVYDFSYTGGNSGRGNIVLKNSSFALPGQSQWMGRCDDEYMGIYASKYYGIEYNSSALDLTGGSVMDYDPIKTKVIMNYALQGCEPGRILSPSREKCIEAPLSLIKALEALTTDPALVQPGTAYQVPECPRFNASLAGQACAETLGMEACTWSWVAQTCDGAPPGKFHAKACEGSLREQCLLWQEQFGSDHPTVNCDIARLCDDPNPSCADFVGTMTLNLRNESVFDSNTSLTRESILVALGDATGIPTNNVETDYAYTLPEPRRLASPAGFQGSGAVSVSTAAPSGPVACTDACKTVIYRFTEVPNTLKKTSWLAMGPTITQSVNSLLAGLGKGDLVDGITINDFGTVRSREADALWQTLVEEPLRQQQLEERKAAMESGGDGGTNPQPGSGGGVPGGTGPR